MKNVQRINESQLRAIVAESVKKVLNEREYQNSEDYDRSMSSVYGDNYDEVIKSKCKNIALKWIKKLNGTNGMSQDIRDNHIPPEFVSDIFDEFTEIAMEGLFDREY